jgi:hypothetical protein
LGAKGLAMVAARPISANGRGDSVFQVQELNGTLVGNFYRDAQSGKMTAVALNGAPATANLTFTNQYALGAAINNRDEIALANTVEGTGGSSGFGVFFRTPDGALQPILVPGLALPDGKAANLCASFPSITDTSVVAFLARGTGDDNLSAYQWEKGSLTPLATVGMDTPDGGKIEAVTEVLLNNQNASALVSAHVAGT